MSERFTIDNSHIGETMVYDWNCPECKRSNNAYEDKPRAGDTLYCEGCLLLIVVTDE